MKKNIIFLIIISKIYVALLSCVSGENYCSKCNPITKLCAKCQNSLYIPNKYGGCDIIRKCDLGNNYCVECSENGLLCIICEIGYYPDEYGKCSYSSNCEFSYQGKCLKCKKNYVLVGIENYSNEGIILCKSLNSEDFQNCASIDSLNGNCIECLEGYYLGLIDKRCTKIENCTKSSFGECKQCIDGFYFDKKENKCKNQRENEYFEKCIETIDGENCNRCENDYYFDNLGKCLLVNFCAKKRDTLKCEECKEGYYLTENDNICVYTDNCLNGDRHTGICENCKENYYLDKNDGKCKSNQDEFKYCKKVDINNTCIQCEKNYYLGNDKKCSKTKNCEKSNNNGDCIKCKEKYYLGLDYICTSIEHCIYSENYECIECEDNYYYDKNYKSCEIAEGNFTDCKYSFLGSDLCERCKNDFYLNETNYLCYSNKENGKFYKCAINYINSDNCDICVEGYHLGYIDRKCSTIEGCDISENENKCLKCDEDYYCLNIKTGKCEVNDKIIDEEKKYLYKCNRTNEQGIGCELCLEGYTFNKNGLCVDNSHCKDKIGEICEKCEEGYCLNNLFGCVEMYFDNCLECDNIFNLELCTKCEDGYEVNEFDTCSKILK